MVPLEIADSLTAVCAFPGCEAEVRVLRSTYCDLHKGAQTHNARTRRRAAHELAFCGVDGEGTGQDYVLLSVGQASRTWPEGARDIREIFSFLWDCYQTDPHAVYVGFYLKYDWNMWLRLLPRERAARLLTDAGRASRTRTRSGGNPVPFPCRYRGWEFDMIPGKRLKLRPRGARSWMWICDAGGFFQCSLMSAIDPARWPDPVVTPAEYALLQAGKDRRDTAVLDDAMIAYNQLENQVLARLLTRYNQGLVAAGVRLDRTRWYGPGQAAQAWLSGRADHATAAVRLYPPALHDALVATYYGGWFELLVHGHVPGLVHEYDLNSAYPAILAALPCPCGTWQHHDGPAMPPAGQLALVRCHAAGTNPWLGGLPFRTPRQSILRARATRGWYWAHEITAAARAGLIDTVTPEEHWAYQPCGHGPPLAGITALYDQRLAAGKDTAYGKACKLIYNSCYGKTAQSAGIPRFGNALWASLTTSGCRTAILDAIATHPGGTDALVMIATDGVFFTTPHPHLPCSDSLGDWSHDVHAGLCLFKPGVYWDDAARQRIAAGEDPGMKTRGISARAFASSITAADEAFTRWDDGSDPVWPVVQFTSGFAQISVEMALARTVRNPAGYPALAGKILTGQQLTQYSDPRLKRHPGSLARTPAGLWRTRPYAAPPGTRERPLFYESRPYERGFGGGDASRDFAQLVTPDGPVMLGLRQALGTGG